MIEKSIEPGFLVKPPATISIVLLSVALVEINDGVPAHSAISHDDRYFEYAG